MVSLVLLALIASSFEAAAALPQRLSPRDAMQAVEEQRLEPVVVGDAPGSALREMAAEAPTQPDLTGFEQIAGPGFVNTKPHPRGEIRTADVDTRPKGPQTGAVEEPSKRTAKSETFRNPDGSFTTALFKASKYFRSGDEYVAIDSTLAPTEGSPGFYRTKSNAWSATFGPIGGAGDGVVVETPAGSVALSPDVSLKEPIVPSFSDAKPNEVRYLDVWADVDLVYTTGPDGVKEDIVLKSKRAAASYSFVFDGAELERPTVGRLKDTPGVFAPKGALGAELYVAPPVVTDKEGRIANTVAQPKPKAEKALAGKAKRAEASIYTIEIDRSWLASLDADDFPVVIDPTLGVGTDVWRNYFKHLASGNQGTETIFYNNNPGGVPQKIGNSLTYGDTIIRSLAHYPYEGLLNANPALRPRVMWADMLVMNHPSSEANPQSVGVYWANAFSWEGATPGYGAAHAANGTPAIATIGSSGWLDVTWPFSQWIAENTPDGQLGFVSTETPSQTSYKELGTLLYITYDYPAPEATNNPNPPNRAIVTGGMPNTFSVDQVANAADGDDIEYRFVFSQFADMSSPAVTSNWFNPPSEPRVSYTAAAGALSPNFNWFWRVETRPAVPASGQSYLVSAPVPFQILNVASKIGTDGIGGNFNGVNTLVGNYSYSFTDVNQAAVAPGLDSTMTINSVVSSGTGIILSSGQITAPFAMRIAENGNGLHHAHVVYPDGREEYHPYQGNNTWLSPPGRGAVVTGVNGVPTTLTMPDGTKYERASFGNTDLISGITDAAGHHLTVTQELQSWPYGVKLHDDVSGRELWYLRENSPSSSRFTALQVTSPSGSGTQRWNFSYGADNQLSSICDASYCRTFGWESYIAPSGETSYRIKWVRDRKGQLEFELTYDTATSRVTQVKNALNQITTYSYYQNPTTFEFATTITDARNNVWVHKFTPQGSFTQQVAPGNVTTTYTNDPTTGLRTAITDAAGHTATLVYDANYRVIVKKNGENEKTFFEHDDAGNVGWECDGRTPDTDANNVPDNHTHCVESRYFQSSDPTTAAAERKQRLIRYRKAPGLTAETWTYTTGSETAYGGSGTMPTRLDKSHTDAVGNTTTYAYFPTGDLGRISDTGISATAGKDLRYTYDGWGRKLTETEYSDTYPSGTTTTWTYTGFGDIETVTYPATTNAVDSSTHQQRITYTYDANHNLTGADAVDLNVAGSNRHTTIDYDLLDREYRRTDPENGVSERRFDAVGNVEYVRDADGRWLRTWYDPRNKPTQIAMLGVVSTPESAPVQQVLSQTTYYANGMKQTETDALSRVTRTTYDLADRELSVVLENYRDDTNSTPRNVLLKGMTYDDAGHLTLLKEGGTGAGGSSALRETSYLYDDAGRMYQNTVAGSAPRTVTLELNALGDIKKKTTTQTSPAGGVSTHETRYDYDPGRRVTCETTENGADDIKIRTTYDTRGVRTSISSPDGTTCATGEVPSHVTNYQADQLKRVTKVIAPTVSVESGGGSQTSVAPETVTGYNAYGDATHNKDANGNTTIHAFDRLSRNTQITHPVMTPAASAYPASSSGPTESYTYDPVGNMTASTSRLGTTTTYDFDDYNRVRYVHDPGSGPGGATFEEHFDTNAWTGWTTSTTNGASSLNGTGGTGNMVFTGASSARAGAPAASQHSDVELTAKVHTTMNGALLIWVRGSTNWMSDEPLLTDGYWIELQHDLMRLLKTRDSNITWPPLVEVEPDFEWETSYRVKIRAVGNNIKARLWPDGSTEPSTWNIDYTDTDNPLTSGRTAVSAISWWADGTINVDDVVLTDPSAAPGGGVTEHKYDLVGNRTEIIDQEGGVTKQFYDDLNRIRREQSIVRSVTVTPQGGAPGPQSPVTIPATSATDVVHTHNDLGYRTQTVTPSGTTTSTYNPMGELLTEQLPGQTQPTVYQRDALGNPVIVTDPFGVQTRNTYDLAGRAIKSGVYANSGATTPASETEHGYDKRANITSEKSPNGYTTTYAYDPMSRLAQVTKPVTATKALTTSYGYDTAGNNTRITYPIGDGTSGPPAPFFEDSFPTNGSAWTSGKWTHSGSQASMTVASNAANATHTGASYGRALASASSEHSDVELTAKVHTTLNGAVLLWVRGSTNWMTDEPLLTDGYWIELQHDLMRLLKTRDSNITWPPLVEIEPDFEWETWYRVKIRVVGNNIKARLWPDGGTEPSTWNIDYTDTDNPLTSGRVAVSTMSWWAEGTVAIDDLAAIDPNAPGGSTTANVITTYNTWNLPYETIEPVTSAYPGLADRTYTTAYNTAGQPSRQTEPGGIVIDSTYDALGRLVGQSTGGVTKTFGYDKAGRQTAMSHPSGTHAFVYDDRSLLVGATGPAGNTVTQYDTAARPQSRDDAAGLHSFGWAGDNLTSIIDPLTGRRALYDWNQAERLAKVTYATPSTTVGPYRDLIYDNIGRLQTDTLKNAAGSQLAKQTYGYDANGNITQNILDLPANSAAGTYDYQYDRSDRLTQFKRTSGSTVVTTNYGWDDAGNRTSVNDGTTTDTYTYNARNRLVTGPQGNYTYNARGGLTAGPGSYTASYDGFGRITSASQGGTSATYTYDALDRVATTTDGASSTFAYADTLLDPSKAGANLYSRSPAGRLIGTQNGTNPARLTGANQHGDINYLWNAATESITDTKTYDPYGKPLVVTGTTNNVGYQGDWTSPTTADTWMGARWYTPATATFRSRDTYPGQLKTPISLNRYTYAHANPIRYFDADGRCVECALLDGMTGNCNGDAACIDEIIQIIDDTAGEAQREHERDLERRAQQAAIDAAVGIFSPPIVTPANYDAERAARDAARRESAFIQSNPDLFKIKTGSEFTTLDPQSTPMAFDVCGTGAFSFTNHGDDNTLVVPIQCNPNADTTTRCTPVATGIGTFTTSCTSEERQFVNPAKGGGGSGDKKKGGSGSKTEKAKEQPVKTPWGWTGSKSYNEATREVDSAGTHEAVGEVVPTREQGERLIRDSGGTIERIEEGHEAPNPHQYPHINYTTSSGKKATIRVQGVN